MREVLARCLLWHAADSILDGTCIPELFAPADLAAMETFRKAFDPARILNPGKILPGGGGCGEGAAHANSHGTRGGIPAQLGGMAVGSGDIEGPWI